MIRLFASDMDGTLLNNKGYISDKTIKAVKRLQKSGVTFLINTGREVLLEVLLLVRQLFYLVRE